MSSDTISLHVLVMYFCTGESNVGTAKRTYTLSFPAFCFTTQNGYNMLVDDDEVTRQVLEVVRQHVQESHVRLMSRFVARDSTTSALKFQVRTSSEVIRRLKLESLIS